MLYCACITDAMRVLNPGVIDSSTSLRLPSAVQAGQCVQDVDTRLRSGDQQPKGYFGIDKKDMPTENIVGAWLGCVNAIPKSVDAARASRQCGCVADAMRANVRYPFRGGSAEITRATPTEGQLRLCQGL
jgi:hypothetical protein